MEKLSEIGAIVLGTMLKVNKSILSTGNQSLVTENVSFHLEKLSDGRFEFQETGEGYTLYHHLSVGCPANFITDYFAKDTHCITT